MRESTNQIFVVDRGNARVQVFADDGSGIPAPESIDFVEEFGSETLIDPVGIAIDQASGAAYVTDAGRGEIVKFNSDHSVAGSFGSVGTGGGDGEFLTMAVGLAVDPVTTDVLVADRGGRVQRFDADGTFLSDFDGSGGGNSPFSVSEDPEADVLGPHAVTVDSSGSIYVADGVGPFIAPGSVEKFTSDGTFVANLPGLIPQGVVAVDAATGDVFATSSGFNGHEVRRFSSTGASLETFGGSGTTARTGIAVDSSLGRAYLVEAATNRVLVFGPVPPTVATGEAADVTDTSATLHGTVDPNGTATSYQFEYGLDDNYGEVIPLDPADIGAGTTPVAVVADLVGLEPNTTYHFRLVAENAVGVSRGDDQTFQTQADAPDPPTVTTGSATDVSAGGATLNGTVDPNGQATGYQFEYGLDEEYGEVIPLEPADVGAGEDPVTVLEAIAGLEPNTTYHFRLVATNVAGSTEGEDAVFTTAPPPPIVETTPATDVTQTGATLNGTVNPNGLETTYQIEYGLSTAYGQKAPAAPVGVGSGSIAVAVAQSVNGLEPSSTYHYRVVATNSSGETLGSDMTFETPAEPPVPPTVTTSAVASIGQASATLNGLVNPNGQPTTWQFEYGTTPALGSVAPIVPANAGAGSSVVSRAVTLTGLSPGTTYHYRLVASNAGGTARGDTLSFTTVAAPTCATDPSLCPPPPPSCATDPSLCPIDVVPVVPAPVPAVPAAPAAPAGDGRKASSRLRIGRASLRGGRVTVSGRISETITRAVRVKLACGRTRLSRTVTPRRGRWSTKIRLRGSCLRARVLRLTVTHPGDSAHKRARQIRQIPARRPSRARRHTRPTRAIPRGPSHVPHGRGYRASM